MDTSAMTDLIRCRFSSPEGDLSGRSGIPSQISKIAKVVKSGLIPLDVASLNHLRFQGASARKLEQHASPPSLLAFGDYVGQVAFCRGAQARYRTSETAGSMAELGERVL